MGFKGYTYYGHLDSFVGVMFASIPNFQVFNYQQNSANKNGLVCIRVLNEIIADFDLVRKSKIILILIRLVKKYTNFFNVFSVPVLILGECTCSI